MPGIAGIISAAPREIVSRDLDTMLAAMSHEPFYRSGKYIDERLGVYVGWTCQEGSFGDCMPLISHGDNAVLIFYGESFPEAGQSIRLRSKGDDQSSDKARHILTLRATYGDDFIAHLNGWFCGIVIDLRQRIVRLFNDRYGMSRVYYHQGESEFLFGSEAKTILKARPSLRVIDRNALAQYLRFNCVMENRSLFKDIALLPAASAWEFSGGAAPAKRDYFEYRQWEEQPTLSPTSFYEKFVEIVAEVFPWYAESSQEVGLSLSAGIDTRLILATTEEKGDSLPCYTFGGPWGELFDIRCARSLATRGGHHFDVIRVGKEFFRDFETYACKSVFLSDGTYDALGAHDVYFNRCARQIAPVRLTGKFGSEVVRTRKLIPRFQYPSGFIEPKLQRVIDEMPSSDLFGLKRHPLSRVLSEELPWYEYGRVTVEQSQVTLRSPYMDNALARLMFQAPSSIRATGMVQEQYIRDRAPTLTAVPTNMGKFVSDNATVTRILYALMWVLFKIEYVYLYATPHWMTRLDRAAGGLRLERLVAGRQKWEGYRIWMCTEFPDFVRDTLLAPEAQYEEFFERKTVEQQVARHLAGTHNYLNEINKALTVELICKTLLK
jgi:asparagine synthase (glutamine-hydrolysing)